MTVSQRYKGKFVNAISSLNSYLLFLLVKAHPRGGDDGSLRLVAGVAVAAVTDAVELRRDETEKLEGGTGTEK